MALKLPSGVYAVVDDGLRPEVSISEKARWALEGGAAVLQLRMERTEDRQALAWVREVVRLAGQAVPVIVNDRVDLCLAGGAAGVHLGDEDLPVDVARSLLGAQALVGRTVRSLADIERAHAQGADHVGLGPIFATSTKQVAAPVLGLEAFERVASASPVPVVGIGGISLETISAVFDAGAHCAALASAWLLATDPLARMRELVERAGPASKR